MAESPEVGRRALAMMQSLAGAMGRGEPAPRGPQRDLVDKGVAVDAVMHAFAAVDDALDSKLIETSRGLYVMEMLMLVREYTEPLPDPSGDEAILHSDLAFLADRVRQARAQELGTPPTAAE